MCTQTTSPSSAFSFQNQRAKPRCSKSTSRLYGWDISLGEHRDADHESTATEMPRNARRRLDPACQCRPTTRRPVRSSSRPTTRNTAKAGRRRRDNGATRRPRSANAKGASTKANIVRSSRSHQHHHARHEARERERAAEMIIPDGISHHLAGVNRSPARRTSSRAAREESLRPNSRA